MTASKFFLLSGGHCLHIRQCSAFFIPDHRRGMKNRLLFLFM